MRFLQDKILILIILTALVQIYIATTRGEWTTRIEQENSTTGDKNHLDLSKTLSIVSEHLISEDNQIIGSGTTFETQKCFTIDSLKISILQIQNDREIDLNRTKTRIADQYQISFDQNGRLKEESLLKTEKIKICPEGQRIEITNWFKYPDLKATKFKIKYFIRTKENETIAGEADLTKSTSFEIHGRHHYDFIILLYPVLWAVMGLLILVKIFRVVKKK